MSLSPQLSLDAFKPGALQFATGGGPIVGINCDKLPVVVGGVFWAPQCLPVNQKIWVTKQRPGLINSLTGWLAGGGEPVS